MSRPTRLSSLALAALLAAVLAGSAPAQGGQPRLPKRERLGLPVREADLCLKCHEGHVGPLREGESFLHGPVGEGRCFDCHAPHASRHGSLLKNGAEQLCFGCHESFGVTEGTRHVHTPVSLGECAKCHDPHRGAHALGLPAEGAALCATCHATQAELAANAELTQHLPFESGECLLCHSPHAGEGPANLVAAGAAVCADCHDLADGDLRARHLGAELAALDCTSCHDPHASPQSGLIHAVAHEPFAGDACDLCHDTGAEPPTALLGDAPDLCLACHDDVSQLEGAVSVHAPAEAGMCLTCHTPHASPRAGLVRGKARDVCLSCHEDIAARAAASASSHLQHDDGNCAGCHQPHASTHPTLLRGEGLAACLGCHQEHAEFAHPMGAAATDPRTGRGIDCLSCHDPHGTAFNASLRADPERDLCIACHTDVGTNG